MTSERNQSDHQSITNLSLTKFTYLCCVEGQKQPPDTHVQSRTEVVRQLRQNEKCRTTVFRSSSRSPLCNPGRVQKGLIHVLKHVEVSGCVYIPEDLRVLIQFRGTSVE